MIRTRLPKRSRARRVALVVDTGRLDTSLTSVAVSVSARAGAGSGPVPDPANRSRPVRVIRHQVPECNRDSK